MKRVAVLVVLLTVLVGAMSFSGVAAQRNRGPQQWLVFSDLSNTASSVVQAQVRLAGGTINRTYSQVGVQLVTSSNTNFARQMSALGLVAAPNRRFPTYKPENAVRMNIS